MSDATADRPRRVSSKKQKKSALFEQLKAGKRKYEVGEIESVYDEVDEKEYTKKVLARQDDDWIVDDGGCGYVEDGREIFDDDLDEESLNKLQTPKSSKKRSRSHLRNEPEGKKGNIRNMLANMPTSKKKEVVVKLDEDDLLGDIIGELDSTPTTPKSFISPAPKKRKEEMSAEEYVKQMPLMKKRPTPASPKLYASPSSATLKSPTPIMSSRYANPNVEIKQEPQSPISSKGIQPKVEIKQDLPSTVSSPKYLMPKVEVKQEPPSPTQECSSSFKKPDIISPGGIKIEPVGEVITAAELDDISSLDLDAFEMATIEAEKNTNKGQKYVDLTKEEKVVTTPRSPAVAEKKVDIDLSDWDKQETKETVCVNVDRSKLPLTTDKEGREVFRFYKWDLHEEPFSQTGTVFMFGKTWVESAKAYVSCCVTVKNISRRIFLLPREQRLDLTTGKTYGDPITMNDVYEEFNNEISNKYKIKMFRSKKTKKKFAFGLEGVPTESEYLEVQYSANFPALPPDLKGETFSHVFGTQGSSLEYLILDRGIKGPCWIDILNPEPVTNSLSHCKVEAVCNKLSDCIVLKNVDMSPIPPLVVVSLRPVSIYNAKNKSSEIVAVSCLVNTSYNIEKPAPERPFNQHFCVLSKPTNVTWPFDIKDAIQKFKMTQVEKMESERALLNFLLTKLWKIDADIIVGHDLSGHMLKQLLDRLSIHKVPNWSRLGRLKRSMMPNTKGNYQIDRIILTGRMLCDIKVSAQELIRSKSYDLDALTENILGKEGKSVNESAFKLSYSSSSSLINSVSQLMTETSYILKILGELNILPLALQITSIAGNVMSRTLMGGRSERNEFLLLHAFYAKDYIVPEKKKRSRKEEAEDTRRAAKKKPAFTGGLVLDPKIGFYDDLILLMDFNSLYPSIIQEYNICYTTIPSFDVELDEGEMDNIDRFFPDGRVPPGILPTEIRKLVESRREVKNLLKNPNLSSELQLQYDIRQKALKLTANSMYGCLGFSNSRFYAKLLAALVTAKGREILMSTKKLVEGHGYEVIYGDTDSIMINSHTKEFEQVNQIGRKIKAEINKYYKNVELDIDGVFKYMLLLRKKKYAAITISKVNGKLVEKEELKGLDIVRRDWSQLASETGKFVVKQILCSSSADDRIENIHGYLENIKHDLEQGKVPLSLLVITKQLTKAPEEYRDIKAMPHVQVAVRLNSQSSRKYKQGDTVPYVICCDGTENPATQRAYHLDELRAKTELSVDVQYYLSQQIHPVVSRLCEPIDGIDAASIALCLGLDPSRYTRQMQLRNEVENYEENIFGKKDEERYKGCQRLLFTCFHCKTPNEIDGPIRKLENGAECLQLERCVNPNCTHPPVNTYGPVMNSLTLAIKDHIDRYYQMWLLCDDPACAHRTNILPSKFDGAYPLCPSCKQSPMQREYNGLEFQNQLCFYSYMFDLTKVSSKPAKFDPTSLEVYKRLYSLVQSYLDSLGYFSIDLSEIFRCLV